jgi:hypothetical protein
MDLRFGEHGDLVLAKMFTTKTKKISENSSLRVKVRQLCMQNHEFLYTEFPTCNFISHHQSHIGAGISDVLSLWQWGCIYFYEAKRNDSASTVSWLWWDSQL